MAKTMRLLVLAGVLAAGLGGCYADVHAGGGWHRCGWWGGWCR